MAELRVPHGATRSKKRIGRGPSSGNGKTSGKGHKGQNARAGGGVRPGFEGGQMPLYRRIARRGFSNYLFKVEYLPVNLDRISNAFSAQEVVDLQALRDKGLVSKNAVFVKVLGRGEIDKAITVKGLKVSAGAQKKIEAAGGTVEAEAQEQTTGESSEG